MWSFLPIRRLRYSTGMPPDRDDLAPVVQDQRKPAPQWCLVATPREADLVESVPTRILALTEDCIVAARQRGWVVIARDSDVVSG